MSSPKKKVGGGGGPVAKPARRLVMLCKYFCVHGPRKQSISKEVNNDNDLKFA